MKKSATALTGTASFIPRKSVYIDTNEFVYARAAPAFPPGHETLLYYQHGVQCIEVLQECRNSNITVFSSVLTQIELVALELDWARRDQLMKLKMPPGFTFGEMHRGNDDVFVKGLLLQADVVRIHNELIEWIETWGFNQVVRWVDPEGTPNWNTFTQVALRYTRRGHVLDALHVGAALALECNKFYTNDQDLRALITTMRQDGSLRRELLERNLINRGYGLPDPISDQRGLLS